MTRFALVLGAVTALALTGCSKKSSVQVAQPTVDPAPAATATTAPPPKAETVGVSQDLAQQCQLRLGNVEQAPKFDYNDDGLAPSDRDMLDAVATCLTKGPLKGKAVRLVGRADPRGTTEYNLGLGNRRASTVADYLKRLGVDSAQLAMTTRGDLDANGQDEDSWRTDRRVDVELAQ